MGKGQVVVARPIPNPILFGAHNLEHSFDIKLAELYGIKAAILLKNLHFWIKKNAANNKHFYEGYFWTYNSVKAFHQLFPYLSEKEISCALKRLEQEGIIKSGEFNKQPYDRTKWYTIINEKLPNDYQIIMLDSTKQKDDLHLTESDLPFYKKENDELQKVEPIPYIRTDNKLDKETNLKTEEFKHPIIKEIERITRELGIEYYLENKVKELENFSRLQIKTQKSNETLFEEFRQFLIMKNFATTTPIENTTSFTGLENTFEAFYSNYGKTRNFYKLYFDKCEKNLLIKQTKPVQEENKEEATQEITEEQNRLFEEQRRKYNIK